MTGTLLRLVRAIGRARGYVAVGLAVAGVGAATTASAQTTPPTADMAVVSIHSNVASAASGTVVTLTEVIRNNGPDAVEMDTEPLIVGGVLVKEVCDLGISADTPACEYGIVNAGVSLTTKFKIRITATSGSLVVKGGVLSEAALQDNNPFNQYKTATVTVA